MVDDGNDEPAAQRVVTSAVFYARHARFRRLLLGIALALQIRGQRVIIERSAQTELSHRFGVHAALSQIIEELFRTLVFQIADVKEGGILQDGVKFFLFFLGAADRFVVFAAFGQLDARFLRQKFHRVGKVQPLDLHDEADHVPALMTAETIVKLLRAVHAERRGLFVMEGTPSPEITAPLFELQIGRDHRNEIVFAFDFVDGLFVVTSHFPSFTVFRFFLVFILFL